VTLPSFPWLPPEINSALIFGGAGSGPLYAASAAWDSLAADLGNAASSFSSVVSGLTNGPWTGPSSLQMAAAATPYVSWLSAASSQAAAAGAQARAAATAFESALTATVPTAAVLENRVQLMTLIATNILGQNTPAIFMTEMEYMEMWAQDVAAMVGYHAGAMSVASTLPAFSVPPVSLAGLAGLLAPLSGIASEAGTAVSTAGSAIMAPVGAVASTATGAVANAASPLVAGVSALTNAVPTSSIMSAAQVLMTPASLMMSPIMMAAQAGGHAPAALADATSAAAAGPKFVDNVVPKGLGGVGGGIGGLGDATAGLGKARLVGAMSVPPTWQGSAPSRMVSAAMSGMGEAMPGAAAAAAPGGGMPMMPMPMGGGGGQGMPGGMMGRGGASPHVQQNRPSVIPRTGVG
jgi:PPE-repeat protein